jgi:hypothetical protein
MRSLVLLTVGAMLLASAQLLSPGVWGQDACGVVRLVQTGSAPGEVANLPSYLAMKAATGLGITGRTGSTLFPLLLSFLLLVPTLYLTYTLGRAFLPDRWAMGATLSLLLVQEFSYHFTSPRLIYAPSLLFTTWALLEIHRTCAGPESARFTRFLAAGAAAAACHPLVGGLVPAGVFALLVIRGREGVRALRSSGALLGLLVWGLAIGGSLQAYEVIPRTSASRFSLHLGPQDLYHTGVVLCRLLPLVSVLWVAGLVVVWRDKPETRVLLASAFLFLGTTVVGLSVYSTRYLVNLAPLLVLLAAAGGRWILGMLLRRGFTLGRVAVAGGLGLALLVEVLLVDGLGHSEKTWSSGLRARVDGAYGSFRSDPRIRMCRTLAEMDLDHDFWLADIDNLAWFHLGQHGMKLRIPQGGDAERLLRERASRMRKRQVGRLALVLMLDRAGRHGTDAVGEALAERGRLIYSGSNGRPQAWLWEVPTEESPAASPRPTRAARSSLFGSMPWRREERRNPESPWHLRR